VGKEQEFDMVGFRKLSGEVLEIRARNGVGIVGFASGRGNGGTCDDGV
jgi:hypothetical protein